MSHPHGLPPMRAAALVRDVLVFQGKLLLDGARDALLIPASLLAGAWDLLRGRGSRDGSFARVLAWGRRSERYINLFGVQGRPFDGSSPGDPFADLDGLIAMIEAQLLDPARRAQLSEAARSQLERALERLRRTRSSAAGASSDDRQDP